MSDVINLEPTDTYNWIERYSENNVLTEESDKHVFNRYFFVDYENVNKDGLNGITKLSKEDCVKIYYSNSAETLTFGLHRRINVSQAFFEYIKVQVPIKNAVDCQILFDIRDLAKINKEAQYYIISKDKDFDKAIEEFKAHNFNVKKIIEVCNISNAEGKKQVKTPVNENEEDIAALKREAQVRSFFGSNFKEKEYTEHKEEIIKIILNAKSKQEINNNLMSIYKNEIVGKIYKQLKPLIKELPGREK